MSIKKISKVQPELFEFTSKNLEKAKNEINKYPKKEKQALYLHCFIWCKIKMIIGYH